MAASVFCKFVFNFIQHYFVFVLEYTKSIQMKKKVYGWEKLHELEKVNEWKVQNWKVHKSKI